MRNHLVRTLAIVILFAGGGSTPSMAATDEESGTAAQSRSVVNPAASRGSRAYNEGRYDEAEQAFIEAIQYRPEQPELYRNLARTYFWKNDYSAATAYYDFYLRLMPLASDAEQIRAERRLASTRAGGEAWTMPESQRLALQALQNELAEGRAFTAGGGGAWGLYRTLLRMGYAQPELSTLRRDLLRRLVDEFEGLLIAGEHQVAPALELEDWRQQNERLSAARTLSEDESVLDMLRRRERIVEAAMALLNHQLDRVIPLLEVAIGDNPDVLFLNWYRIYTLSRQGKAPAALEALEHFARRLAQSAPHQLAYARVVRASLLEQVGRRDDAVQLYLELLLEP
jgi:tetratricopeptide (TPR) repeat protein